MGATDWIADLAEVEGDGEGSASNPFAFAFAGDAVPIAIRSMIQANWLLTQFLARVITAQPPSELQVMSRRSIWCRLRHCRFTIFNPSVCSARLPERWM